MNLAVVLRMGRGGFTRVLAVALLLCVGWSVAGQYLRVYNSGAQCATAPVQSILVAAVSASGQVGYTERPVQPGDKAFVPCRCAAKRAAGNPVAGGPAPSAPACLSAAWQIQFPLLLAERRVAAAPAEPLLAVAAAPRLRPPA